MLPRINKKLFETVVFILEFKMFNLLVSFYYGVKSFRWHCFPVGLHPLFKQHQRNGYSNIIKQYVNKYIYNLSHSHMAQREGMGRNGRAKRVYVDRCSSIGWTVYLTIPIFTPKLGITPEKSIFCT